MTVSSEQSRVQYATDGVTTSFPVPFRFLQNRDLRVTLVGSEGNEQELALDVDYSVTGAGQQSGGTLTTTSAYPAGQTLLIDRIVSITQETAYQRNDPFPERAHERALDKLTMICQQLASIFGMTSIGGRRVLMVRDSDGGIGFLPLRRQRANHALGFDANGDPVAIPSDLPQLVDALERAEAAAESAEEDAASAAADSATAALDANRAETAADAATISGRVFDDVGQGLSNTTSGQYFSVPADDSQESLILYRNSSGTGVEIKRYPSSLFDSLTANRGKNYPLRPMVRDGIMSDPSPVWNALVHDASVLNAQPGKLYQLSYYQNGAVIGTAGYGWVIREFDEATYATAAGKGRFIVNYNDALQMPVDRSLGIQQIRLQGTDGIEVRLVVDPAALPEDGTPINSNTFPSHQAWSWVIDPVLYVKSNRPVLPLRRNGVRSSGNDFLDKALVDFHVIGARPGKVYGIRYFKNGTPLLSGPSDGWVIEEQDASNYALSGDASVVLNYTDPAPDIPRNGIQSFMVQSPAVMGLSFAITLDTDKLPPYETPVRMNGPTWPGYSWAVDPSNYTYAPDGRSIPECTDHRLQWRTTADKRVVLTFQSSTHLYRVTIGPNGRNGLPNIISIEHASSWTGSFSMLWQGVTDWIPPVIIMAVNDGVLLPNGRIFTGGNHGSDGSGGGDSTAVNVLWDCVVDGSPMPWVEAAGYASQIDMRIVNDVMAANTVITEPPRYVIRENFRLIATKAGIGLCARRTANEDIELLLDYGIQATTSGFQSEMVYIGGVDTSWIPYSAATNSGIKAVSPLAWAVALRSASGQLVLWQDREYEAGDARYINDDAPIIRGGGSTHKVYGGIAGKAVLGAVATIEAGNGWAWRGGWSIQAPDLSPDGIDALIQLQRAQGQSQVVVNDAHNWVVL